VILSSVIPGQPARLNPESIAPQERLEKWIPDSRYAASGMTIALDTRSTRHTDLPVVPIRRGGFRL